MYKIYFLFALLFFPLFAWSDQLIVEPDMGRKPILNAINSTEHSLKLVMYGFTDQSLLQAILQQKQRGRTVKILLEQSPYHADTENKKAIALFKENHVDLVTNIPSIDLIHQKTLIIDDKHALIMTFNFTKSTFKNDRNFALVIDNPRRIREIETRFDADWQQKASNPTSDIGFLWSPENSRALLSLIKNAKQHIDIYAQHLNDYQTIGALALAAKKGVVVNILTSTKLRKGQAAYLKRAGVNIKHSQTHYIHAKAFVIDDKLAVIGSLNLTSASFDRNRELAAVTSDPDVVKELQATFDKDWRNSLLYTQ